MQLTLDSPIVGVNASANVTAGALTGGADAEDDDSLRARLLARIKEPPQGGSKADYVTWALEVPGVTRAWCYPEEMGDGTVTLRCAGVDATIVAEAGPGEVSVGAEAGFAIRPEKVQISLEAPPAGTSNVLSGEVWDIGYLGDISVYRVRLAGGSIVKATVANLTRIVERPITWEDKVYLTWPADAGIILLK